MSKLTVDAAGSVVSIGSPRDPMRAFASAIETRGNHRLRHRETRSTIDFTSASHRLGAQKNQVGWTSTRNPLKSLISRMHRLFRQARYQGLSRDLNGPFQRPRYSADGRCPSAWCRLTQTALTRRRGPSLETGVFRRPLAPPARRTAVRGIDLGCSTTRSAAPRTSCPALCRASTP